MNKVVGGPTSGEIEQKIKRANRQKAILEAISGVGVLSMAVFTPGALRGVAMLKRFMKNRNDPHNTYRTFQRLIEKGYISLQRGPKRTLVTLTEKGRTHLLHLGNLAARRPDRWDGYWRVVIYDIEEKKKYKRHLLQETLRNTGFYRLQDSVWVYPYPCDELVMLLKAEYQLGKEVLYMAVKHLENDGNLRKFFGVKKE